MAFKKIIPALKEVMEAHSIIEANEFQKKIIPKIKSGADVFGIGAEGTGKTTALLIAILQKLKFKAQGDNPRVLIFVKDKEAALALEEHFKKWMNQTDLRVYSVVEEHHIYNQKDLIYAGMDVVIATPNRLSKLYFQNGINLNELQMIVVEDANFLNNTSFLTDINRISESFKRMQHVVFATHFDPKLEKMKALFMERAYTINI
ncbi:MAG: DEAD/DEAH box helicase [Flavobacteriales bacterium]|jgi:superfamily II DNA/RNA helicase|nr:DEAD/DEAH box helicase [Flavobacteriales bacterium]